MSKRHRKNITSGSVKPKDEAHGLAREDILERKADLRTMQSMREVKAGLSEPIDDLLEMIEEDRRIGEEMRRNGKIVALQKALIEGEESGFVDCSLEELNRELDEEDLG